MRDMMDYHCLRVFRSHDRRIGKHSPGFSVFQTRVHGCSDAEPCRVPIQSTFVEMLQTEMSAVTEGTVMGVSAEMEMETTGHPLPTSTLQK